MFKQHNARSKMPSAPSSFVHVLLLLGIGLAAYRFYRSDAVTWSTWSRGSRIETVTDFESQCLKFKPRIANAKVELVKYLAADSKARLSYRDTSCGGPGFSAPVTQDVCRVALYVPTSARSGIHLEAWLPKSWNSRFLGTGNGGIGGCLDYASLTYTTAHGFAAVASNNGHNGTGGEAFYQNPNVVHDFADRSLHTSVITGKALVKQFYGIDHKKSYFLGCSQGGRQGIANAMKFPHDFDGIVAGAPALDFNSLVSWRASFLPLTGAHSPDPSKFISASMWSGLIHDEVMRQCDHLDGVLDGIIEYPDLCDFEPEVLQCKSSTTPDGNCLTQTQVAQVRRIFSAFRHVDGTVIYPGMQLGSEQRAIERLYAGKPFTDSRDWFKYVVHSNPSWDPASFTTEDARKAQQLDPFSIRTLPAPSDMFEFRKRGGKILVYHGMQDQQITGHNTGRWLEHLRSQSPEEELEIWLRYFRISGLSHCVGGAGAWKIGQTGGFVDFDPQRNVLSAVVEWIENGRAPEVLEGTSQGEDNIERQFARKHCRYPKRNRYIGSTQDVPGDSLPETSVADEWICD